MRILWGIVFLLFVIVCVMGYLLLSPVPPPSPSQDTAPVQILEETAATTTADGALFPEALSSKVNVTVPLRNAIVGNVFEVRGEAPGNWFFEASFPIQLRDSEGNVLARGIANAEGEWMTTEQVPFLAKIELEKFYEGTATLVLLRDNPSGLPENDDSLEVPLTIQ